MTDLPRFARDFAAAFDHAGGNWARMHVYWPGMTACTWPGHEEGRPR
jgi:hypothetical protein